MNVDDAVREARQLLADNGLTGWRIETGRSVHVFGRTYGWQHKIRLSEPLIRANGQDRVRACILHEIAHAKVGCSHGHDEIWRAEAFRLGGNAASRERFGESDTVLIPSRYVGTCECGPVHSRERMLKGRSYGCRRCNATVTWERR